jgi:hypothetical protein
MYAQPKIGMAKMPDWLPHCAALIGFAMAGALAFLTGAIATFCLFPRSTTRTALVQDTVATGPAWPK